MTSLRVLNTPLCMYGALLRMSRSVGVLNAPGGTLAPGSSQPGRFGTSVLGRPLSVNSGPPWQAMHAPLPWKSTSPRCAAADIVPWSKLVVGALIEPTYASSAAACSPVFWAGWVAPSLKWLRIVLVTIWRRVGVLPIHPY